MKCTCLHGNKDTCPVHDAAFWGRHAKTVQSIADKNPEFKFTGKDGKRYLDLAGLMRSKR